MRSSKSRSRSKSNRNRSMGNIVNRVFDSSGPEGKVRGTPQQIIDKYNQLARDAQLANDRVAMENFQQHAEHYMRMLGEALREQEARREAQDSQARDRQQQQQQQPQPEPRGEAPATEADTPGMPEVIDVATEADSGLVDTPEAGPSRSGRPRRRGPRSRSQEDAPQPDGGGADTPGKPEAAE